MNLRDKARLTVKEQNEATFAAPRNQSIYWNAGVAQRIADAQLDKALRIIAEYLVKDDA